MFEGSYAARMLSEHFRIVALDGFGLSEHPQAISAAGALVHYLRETSAIGARRPEDTAIVPSLRPAGAGLEHLDRIAYYEQQDAMILDQVTARNLELIEPAAGDDASATLFRAIDETVTGMGARLLRTWMLRRKFASGRSSSGSKPFGAEIPHGGARRNSKRIRGNFRPGTANEPDHPGEREPARFACAARLT